MFFVEKAEYFIGIPLAELMESKYMHPPVGLLLLKKSCYTATISIIKSDFLPNITSRSTLPNRYCGLLCYLPI